MYSVNKNCRTQNKYGCISIQYSLVECTHQVCNKGKAPDKSSAWREKQLWSDTSPPQIWAGPGTKSSNPVSTDLSSQYGSTKFYDNTCSKVKIFPMYSKADMSNRARVWGKGTHWRCIRIFFSPKKKNRPGTASRHRQQGRALWKGRSWPCTKMFWKTWRKITGKK